MFKFFEKINDPVFDSFEYFHKLRQRLDENSAKICFYIKGNEGICKIEGKEIKLSCYDGLLVEDHVPDNVINIYVNNVNDIKNLYLPSAQFLEYNCGLKINADVLYNYSSAYIVQYAKNTDKKVLKNNYKID